MHGGFKVMFQKIFFLTKVLLGVVIFDATIVVQEKKGSYF